MNPFHRLHNLRMENDAAGFTMQEMRPRFERMANRHENGTAPRAVVAYQLFQTPPELAARLVALLDLKPLERVLEPSAGLGRLLDAIPRECETVAVEIAPQCARELYETNRVNVHILQRDFLTVTCDEIGEFDAVAMNPPFHLRSDIKHILWAFSFLKPGGRLAALCLDTPHREAALKPLASTWERVEGAFGKEGTRVNTILLTIKRPEENNRAARNSIAYEQ